MRFPPILALLALWLPSAVAGADLTSASRPPVDVVIYGATPGGIATAVRAARAGLQVTLVHHHAHIGGMMSNGLGILDTIFPGKRAPLYDEMQERIKDHYRDTYGPTSTQYRLSAWQSPDKPSRPTYEPRVAEGVFEAMLRGEKNITVVRGYFPAAAERAGRKIAAVRFQPMASHPGQPALILAAAAFVDASYEGDLAAIAGANMTWGREGRAQYNEPHAGKIFLKARFVSATKDYFPTAMRTEGLNVRGFRATTGEILPGSTGEGDKTIQAYNFRVCWTRDPANRLPVPKPARYERAVYLELRDRWSVGGNVPNLKASWNTPLLIGGNYDYPGGSWAVRQEIAARHRDLALGLMWFLQNDPEVPAKLQAEAREWGLPKDEFTDNGGFPWEMYVREARRLVGRQVFTENDGRSAPGLPRAPVHAKSIAITEWPLDSHSCSLETVPGSDHEGKVLLTEETRPGQISYDCLLPKELDNLLVTGAISSSHIGWGTIRLEPTWMHVGESAAWALALAREQKVAPAEVPVEALQRRLVEHGIMLGFFNDFDMGAPTAEQKAAQYFSPRGFFPGYHARLDAPLSAAIAAVWARPDADPLATARRVAAAEKAGGPSAAAADFARLAGRTWANAPAGPLTRGAACSWLFSAR